VEGAGVSRRLLAVVAGVAAFALSIPAALLGRAVLATPAAVARETAGTAPDTRVGALHRSLAERAAWHLVAADRSEPFTEIVRTYRTVAALPALSGEPVWSIRLAHLIPRLRTPEERAQAYVMAGTLLALAAGDGLGVAFGDSDGARALLVQALDDFRAAVRNDDGSEEAKYDLELLLKQQVERESPEDTGGTTRKTAKPKPEPSDGKRRQDQPLGQSRIEDAGVYATGSGY
jgi:hypothetical protein